MKSEDIPTGQTKDDLKPAVKLAHSLANNGIPENRIVFALVKTTNSETEINAARVYLGQTEYLTLDGFIPVSTAYGTAHDVGRAITETSYKSLNKKAEKLAQAIVDRLVKITQPKKVKR